MYCFVNICNVCLKPKNEPISIINSELSVNRDIIHIIGYLPLNLAWLRTKKIILICEECRLRLRETYQFMAICLKNSALLQSYTNRLNTSTASSNSSTENEAMLTVTLDLTNIHEDMNGIKLEDGKMCADNCEPAIEETEDRYVNIEDYFVKEEDTWKREVTDDEQEHSTNNNSTDNINKSDSEILMNITKNEAEVTEPLDLNNKRKNTNEEVQGEIISKDGEMYTDQFLSIIEETEDNPVNSEYIVEEEEREDAGDQEEHPTDNNSNASRDTESEISINSNAYITDTESDSSGFTRKQVHSKKKKEWNTVVKNSYTCSKSFSQQSDLTKHTRVHRGEKLFKCSRCEKYFILRSNLATHMKVHTGDKPYKCLDCGKCFNARSNLNRHMRVHTGEKPYKCSDCGKCFNVRSNLNRHMRVHTGEKPYKCSDCGKSFTLRPTLTRHMKEIHTGEKRFKCSRCEKYFNRQSNLATHMRVHTVK